MIAVPVTVSVPVTLGNIQLPASVAPVVGAPAPDVAAGHRELPVLTISSS
jgi:hypothetical protein